MLGGAFFAVDASLTAPPKDVDEQSLCFQSLWDHQKQSVKNMLKHEEQLWQGPNPSNIGIYADDIGSGKTRSALALIATRPHTFPSHVPALLAHTPLAETVVKLVNEYATPSWAMFTREKWSIYNPLMVSPQQKKIWDRAAIQSHKQHVQEEKLKREQRRQGRRRDSRAVVLPPNVDPGGLPLGNPYAVNPLLMNFESPPAGMLAPDRAPQDLLLPVAFHSQSARTDPAVSPFTESEKDAEWKNQPQPLPLLKRKTTLGNLVVVPFPLFRQWKETIEKCYNIISTQRKAPRQSRTKKSSEANDLDTSTTTTPTPTPTPTPEKKTGKRRRSPGPQPNNILQALAVDAQTDKNGTKKQRRKSTALKTPDAEKKAEQKRQDSRFKRRPHDNGLPKLTCMFLTTAQDMFDETTLANHDLVLCNSKKYAAVAALCEAKKLTWQRVFFDEAHKIDLPGCKPVESVFYWAITTTFTALPKMKNRGFLKSIFDKLPLDQLQAITVSTPVKSIDKRSYQYPPFIKMTVQCFATLETRLINECYPGSWLAECLAEERVHEARAYLQRGIPMSHLSYLQYSENMILYQEKSDMAQICLGHVPSEQEATEMPGMGPRRCLDYGIFELQLRVLSYKTNIGPFTRACRLLLFLQNVIDANACLRCCRTFRFTDGEPEFSEKHVPPPTVRTRCCGLLYCEQCVPFVHECPICFMAPGTPWARIEKDQTPGHFAIQTMKERLRLVLNKMKTQSRGAAQTAMDKNAIVHQQARSFTQQSNVYDMLVSHDAAEKRKIEEAFLAATRVREADGEAEQEEEAEGAAAEEDWFREPDTVDLEKVKAAEKEQEAKSLSSSGSRDDLITIGSRALSTSGSCTMSLHNNRAAQRRQRIDRHHIETRISNFVERPCSFIEPATLDKKAVILRILEHHPKERILISTSSAAAARQMTELMKSANKTSRELKGNFNVIPSLLAKFKAGTVPILIMNGQHTGNGLNIEMADVLIVAHVKSNQLLLQLIGRAQRPNREQKPLLVYCITFHGEETAKLKQIALSKTAVC